MLSLLWPPFPAAIYHEDPSPGTAMGARNLWFWCFGWDTAQWGWCFGHAKRGFKPKDRLWPAVVIGFNDALKNRRGPIGAFPLIFKNDCDGNIRRSEERRVGKECR